jgi:hypothetical protein
MKQIGNSLSLIRSNVVNNKAVSSLISRWKKLVKPVSDLPNEIHENKLVRKETISILFPHWKDLIKFPFKNDRDPVIEVVKGDFRKMISRGLPDFLNSEAKYNPEEINFRLHIGFDKLERVLKTMGNSELYDMMFDPGTSSMMARLAQEVSLFGIIVLE